MRLLKVMCVMTATLMTGQAAAAFTLNGSRFIYEEGKKNISLEVTNNAKETYAGQVWITNISQNKSDVFMVPAPPFFKVVAGQKQIIRLSKVSDALPSDRESLFWLNVQEVPPKPKVEDGQNILSIAMNTQVKLIYRPKALVKARNDAEKNLTLVTRDGRMWVNNPTPYYFAVTEIKVNGKVASLPAEKKNALTILAPFTAADTGLAPGGKVSVKSINDYGGIDDYEIQ
ncbi:MULTISPECIES: fimbrial chaperone [Citrobacter]|uniref:fimbrial chaperone n=1 Tax=Citrobacter TaxID=544 RepID=UPI00143D353C|nr:fimbrial chaperone [Citrobacter sp. L55]